MLMPKMIRAQKMRAHKLALDKNWDVLVTWDLPPVEPDGSDYRLKREILMTEDDHRLWIKAVCYHCIPSIIYFS